MRDWDLFLRLQSELPRDVTIESPRMRAPIRGVGTLFIGPGGANELRAMTGRLPEPFTVLTADRAEADSICAELPEVRTVCGDMHDMPLPSGAFHAVHALQVLEHALAPYVALMHIRRVLGHGGTAHLSLPSFAGIEGGRGPFHLHCLDPRVWRELLHKTGLEVREMRDEVGTEDPNTTYTFYTCEAVAPPRPHDIILDRLIEARK